MDENTTEIIGMDSPEQMLPQNSLAEEAPEAEQVPLQEAEPVPADIPAQPVYIPEAPQAAPAQPKKKVGKKLIYSFCLGRAIEVRS